eukprot:7808959-Pyramimonas_sp.AAC.3
MGAARSQGCHNGATTGPQGGHKGAARSQGGLQVTAHVVFGHDHPSCYALVGAGVRRASGGRAREGGVLEELVGGGPEKGGSLLRQIPVPPEFVGYRYRHLTRYLIMQRFLVPVALYRVKVRFTSYPVGRCKMPLEWHLISGVCNIHTMIPKGIRVCLGT